jgi:hypothetical protein
MQFIMSSWFILDNGKWFNVFSKVFIFVDVLNITVQRGNFVRVEKDPSYV